MSKVSDWVTSNVKVLGVVIPLVATGVGVGWDDMTGAVSGIYDKVLEGEQLKGYENARSEFRPKIDSLNKWLNASQLDAARAMWERDMCCSEQNDDAGGTGGAEWNISGLPDGNGSDDIP